MASMAASSLLASLGTTLGIMEGPGGRGLAYWAVWRQHVVAPGGAAFDFADTTSPDIFCAHGVFWTAHYFWQVGRH